MPRKKKKKKPSSAAAAVTERLVVGPDYVQLLRGSLLGREVALLLCGESHEDAVDVTRSGGKFTPLEGWVETDAVDLAAEMYGRTFGTGRGDAGWGGDDEEEDGGEVSMRHRVLRRQMKPVPLGKARDWAASTVKDDLLDEVDMGEEIALVWAPTEGIKGRAYLVSLVIFDDEEEKDDGKDECENGGGGNRARKTRQGRSSKKRGSAVPEVADLVASMDHALQAFHSSDRLADAVKACSAATTGGGSGGGGGCGVGRMAALFQWTDLDPEARALSHRRLIGEDVPTAEYDALIQRRKVQRRKDDGIWTWDDWLAEARSRCAGSGVCGNGSGGTASGSGSSAAGGGVDVETNPSQTPAMHVVLEASIPPWEVELHRSSEGANSDGAFTPTRAAECIRCLSEDSECSSMDVHDPAADGIGSFIDYMYRRFMEEQAPVSSAQGGGDSSEISQWLHCVDSRDLGCEHACVADSLHERWLGLLRPEERAALLGGGDGMGEREIGETSSPCTDVRAHWKGGRCYPEFALNPEESHLEELRAKGELRDDDPPCEARSSDFPVTFPSFELFFGQNTDILYYDPHVKVAYAPFLAKCVQSMENWEKFFTALFFGGSIAEALSCIDLQAQKRPYLHIRSPILQAWDPESGKYEWSRRGDEEMDVTSPFLPVGFHLKAAGSDPPRTWSSQIYADLIGKKGSAANGGGRVELARSAREWALAEIRQLAADPKGSDDEHGGGEWFLAYLRAVHRDVYDDIDRSDPGELLKKKYMAGESDGRPRKHKIGDISVPHCAKGFEDIVNGSSIKEVDTASPPTALEEWTSRKKIVSGPLEVMAKILIDIWMSKLVDFSTILKIAQVVADEKKNRVVVVCYMGSVHTRATAEFYCDHMGFKKKAFVGNLNWDEDQARTLQFPPAFWDPSFFF